MQVNYDTTTPMLDMMAQIAVNDAVLSLVQSPPASVEYALEARTRLAQAFFDLSSSATLNGNFAVHSPRTASWKPRQSRKNDLRQARQIIMYLILILNQNVQDSTCLNVNFHSYTSPSNV